MRIEAAAKTTQSNLLVNRPQPSREPAALQEQAEKPRTEWSKGELLAAIEQANRALQNSNRQFDFTVHEETNIIMVRVINSDTGELIKEIPPEKILNLIANLWELAGIVVDERR